MAAEENILREALDKNLPEVRRRLKELLPGERTRLETALMIISREILRLEEGSDERGIVR